MTSPMKKKVLVVVAHPDDETIWMGGTLLMNFNKWELTVISLCRKDDRDRAPKFRKACGLLKAKCFISDLEDEKLNNIPLSETIKRIERYSEKCYELIFTHGENGEYGHKRHIDVNRAVREMLKRKSLSAEKVFFFSYTKKGNLCCADKKSNKFIKLEDFYLNRKKWMIHNLYGFDKKSFEYLCCKNEEAFNVETEF